MSRRILALLLTLAMCLGMWNPTAFAAESEEAEQTFIESTGEEAIVDVDADEAGTEAGTIEGEVVENGTPEDGATERESFNAETPEDGATEREGFNAETPEDGATEREGFNAETPEDGATEGEDFNAGTPEDGATEGEDFNAEIPEDGTAEGEDFNNGTPADGAVEGEDSNAETPEDGATVEEDENTESGTAEEDKDSEDGNLEGENAEDELAEGENTEDESDETECEHEEYEDGKCVECGIECEHEEYEDGKCAKCGMDEEISEAVWAFLNVVETLPEEVTEENYEEVAALLEACMEAYDALDPADYERDDVYAAILKIVNLLEAVNVMAAENYVAMIGETGYGSFSDAMKALKDGETLVLLKDVNSDGMYMLQNPNDVITLNYSYTSIAADDITVDLNGHMITATGNATQSSDAYGIFRMRAGRTLTIVNSDAENIGTINGKIVNSTNGNLNLEGPGKIDIRGKYTNRTIGSYGDIYINAPIDKLTVTANHGTVTIGMNGFVNNLTVNMIAATETYQYTPSLIVNGYVTTLTVTQTTPHPTSQKNASNVNTLEINAPVGTLKLTQSIAAMNPSKANSWNKAYINAPVGTMDVTQTGKASQLYLNSEIGSMELKQGQGGGYSTIENDVPLTQAGTGFHVGTLNVTVSRISFANKTNVANYSDPTIAVDDLVIMTGMDGHEITVDQMESSTWKASNGTVKFEFEGVDYKYLTTVQVMGGEIVLHKTVLNGDTNTVYLDGVNGNNENDGSTPVNAFKTFEEACAALNKEDLNTIIIVNTVVVTGNETWDMGNSAGVNGILKRYEKFSGAMVNVADGGSLTISNIIFDGGKEDGYTASAPLVTVQSNGQLTIDRGTTLRYNANTGSTRGGAVNNRGSLIINGGLITGNTTIESGGGIYSTGSIEMNGGEISKNSSTKFSGADNKSSGGGICIGQDGSMVMNGGLIANNSTRGYLAFGGGIALGDASSRTGMKLVMNGGTIEGNVCQGNGGGIAVWTGGVAEINSGYIINNICNSNTTDWVLSYYGGGGVYVNKGATLTLKNVEVTNNSALSGSGIAACPTSNVRFYIKKGGVFYGSGSSIWISTIQGGFGTVPVSVTGYTMNGYKYNWNNGAIGAKDLNLILSAWGEYPRSLSLQSGLTDEQGRRAAQYCTVHITGNSSGANGYAYNGGGIGCNGTLIIGEDSNILSLEKKVDGNSSNPLDTEFKFTVEFRTDDGNLYNGTVTLLQGGEIKENVSLNGGKLELTLVKDECVVFQDLPLGVSYNIVEGDTRANKVTVSHTTVTELSNLDGYTNPVINTGNEENKEITDTVVKGIDEIVFTNTYDTGMLTITKSVKGGSEVAGKTYTFTVTGPSYPNGHKVFLADREREILTGLIPGEYKVEEDDAGIDNYDWLVEGTGNVTVVANLEKNVDVVNTYIRELGNLTITKTVTGLEGAEAKEKHTFTFMIEAVGDALKAEVSGNSYANMDTPFNAEGIAKVSITVVGNTSNEVKIQNLPTGEYMVTEDVDAAAVRNHDLSVWVGSEKNHTTLVTIKAERIEKVAVVSFTNTYMPYGSLTISKSVVGGPESAGTEQPYTFIIVGKDADGKLVTGTYAMNENDEVRFDDGVATITIVGAGNATLKNLPLGEYTVTEIGDAEMSNHTWTVSVDGKETKEGTAKVTADIAAEVTITNTYVPYGSLTITKEVTGGPEGAATEMEYTFTIVGKDTDGNPVTGDYAMGEDKVVFDENGKATVTIKGANSITIEKLPLGEYTVSEDIEKAKVENYMLSVVGKDGVKADVDEAGKNAEVTITNNYTDDAKLTVNKVWSDGAEKHVDGSVTVNILNGTEIVETVILNAENNWTATVDGLKIGQSYTVEEVEVKGYTTSYKTNEDGSITITNTHDEPTPTPGVTPGPTPIVTPEPTPEVTPEPTPEVTPEPTPEVTPEPTPEVTPEPTPEVTPTPTPEVEIPEEEPPFGTPDVTPTPTPEVEIPEEETPFGTPDVSPTPTSEPTPEIEIPEEETPLADGSPKTGDSTMTWLWAMLSLLSAGIVLVLLPNRKRQK